MPTCETSPWNEFVSLLIDGARHGDVEDVLEALKGGANVNAQDDLGRTALHMASANGRLELVQLLLEAGADVGTCNVEKNTPLHWACLNGHVQVVALLLKYGASPTALNTYDRTPMDEALLFEKEEVMHVIRKFQGDGPTGEDPEVGIEEEVEEMHVEEEERT